MLVCLFKLTKLILLKTSIAVFQNVMCEDELVTADLRIFPSIAFLVAAFT